MIQQGSHHRGYQWRLFFGLLISVFVCSSASAAEPDYSVEDHFAMGIGAGYNSSIYQGIDGYVFPDLFFDMQQGNFYAQGQTFGWDFVRSERVTFGFAATRGAHFLDTGEVNSSQEFLYYGIEDRDRAYEVGLMYRYRSRVGLVSFEYWKDASDAYDGLRTTTRLARPIPNDGGMVVIPSLFVNYYSTKFNQYYYGVSRAENERAAVIEYGVLTPETLENVRDVRPDYTPGNSAHLGVDIHIRMPVSEQLLLTAYFAYEDITGEAFRSPLVEDRKQYISTFGLMYNF